jgi:hypothetical protein
MLPGQINKMNNKIHTFETFLIKEYKGDKPEYDDDEKCEECGKKVCECGKDEDDD